MELKPGVREKILRVQRSELNEHLIYAWLARSVPGVKNREILGRISQEELAHYQFWKGYLKEETKPNRWLVWRYYLISKLFGFTFGLKLMERGEEIAQEVYQGLVGLVPDVAKIIKEEELHEKELLGLLDEERLKYIGSMVLGLNDALVELTGALAGFTLALQNTRLIALVGLVTGIAGSLSMASSEYISTKSESPERNPLKASLYTGIAYMITVFFLIFPYLLLENFYLALGLTLTNAILVILFFSYYISVVKELKFWKRFTEMIGISLGVTALSFGIGFMVRKLFRVEI